MGGPYLIGNVIRLRAAWTDPNSLPNPNNPIDPSTVTVEYADPTGAVTSATYPAGGMVKESVGVYHLDVTVSIPGTWWYDGISTGIATARSEASFLVTPSKVKP